MERFGRQKVQNEIDETRARLRAVLDKASAVEARNLRREQELDAREKALFATQGTQGIQFDKYANIKVECRGPGSDAAPPLDDFGALTSLPPFLARNIGLMNYVKPTPIQRHAVPLALAGVALKSQTSFST